MRVLLDECVPRKLRRELPGHEVRTVAEMGWAGFAIPALSGSDGWKVAALLAAALWMAR